MGEGEKKAVTTKQIAVGVTALIFVVIVVAGVIWSLMPRGPTQLIIRVTSTGSWSGVYGDVRGMQSVEGTGSKTFTINRGGQQIWIVSAVFQKRDWGIYELKVTIETPDGKILRSGSTTAEFGVVSLAWSSEE